MSAEGIIDLGLQRMWEEGTRPTVWGGATKPDDDLLWGDGHSGQIRDLISMEQLLGMPVRVVGTHRSKSVELPVAMFQLNKGSVHFFVRDNFYDLKLVVVSEVPIEMDPGQAHYRMTQEEYDAEKKRCFDYREHTNDDSSGREFDNDDWFDTWSSGSIMRHNGNIYRCASVASCYYEGISRIAPESAFQVYKPGVKQFATDATNTVDVMSKMVAVQAAVRRVM